MMMLFSTEMMRRSILMMKITATQTLKLKFNLLSISVRIILLRYLVTDHGNKMLNINKEFLFAFDLCRGYKPGPKKVPLNMKNPWEFV